MATLSRSAIFTLMSVLAVLIALGIVSLFLQPWNPPDPNSPIALPSTPTPSPLPTVANTPTSAVAAAPEDAASPTPELPASTATTTDATPTDESATDATPTARTSPTPSPSASATATSGVLAIGANGRQFLGAVREGPPIDAEAANGGACIEGRVTDSADNRFENFLVQVDRAGRTVPAELFFDTGRYRICGLERGDWGVAVYTVNGASTGAREQIGHQVRLRVRGEPGEVYYVDFRARRDTSSPIANTTGTPTATAATTGTVTLTPTSATTETVTLTPTGAPAAQYNGIWQGTLSGTTTTGEFSGRFELEIRDNAIYRISLDGPSCPFETYPSFPNGQRLRGEAFSVAGQPNNPISGVQEDVNFIITGRFTSGEAAEGTLEATTQGQSCASATWAIKR
jgi:hypothetical protein